MEPETAGSAWLHTGSRSRSPDPRRLGSARLNVCAELSQRPAPAVAVRDYGQSNDDPQADYNTGAVG